MCCQLPSYPASRAGYSHSYSSYIYGYIRETLVDTDRRSGEVALARLGSGYRPGGDGVAGSAGCQGGGWSVSPSKSRCSIQPERPPRIPSGRREKKKKKQKRQMQICQIDEWLSGGSASCRAGSNSRIREQKRQKAGTYQCPLPIRPCRMRMAM